MELVRAKRLIYSMNILLTGSSGFIGKNILNYFTKEIHYENYFNIHCLSRGQSLTDFSSVQFDSIIHSAAEIYQDNLMFDSNIKLTYDLLEFAKNQKHLKSFINLGSSSEYGHKKNKMSENDLLQPRNIYESTKGAATLLCQGFAKKYNIPAITIRLFSVYGSHEPNHRLIPTIYQKFLKQECVEVSEGSHDFVYIDDIINLIIKLLNEPKEKIAGDIINAGTGIQTSNFEVVQLFEKILGFKININKVSQLRSFDSLNWVCDPNYTYYKYSWRSETPLENGIKKYLETLK